MAFDPVTGFVSEDNPNSLRATVLEQQLQIDTLSEAWDEAAAALLRLRQEDVGWNLWGAAKPAEDGFSLKLTQDIAEKAEVQSAGNPLLKHGLELRTNGVFSKGLQIKGDMKPRFQRKIESEVVQELLFCAEGYEANEKALYNTGNLFLAYNVVSQDLIRIPFKEIANRAVDPENATRTAYYLWKHTVYDWNGKSTPISEWIPTVEWNKGGNDTQDEIGRDKVNHDWLVIDFRVNVPTSGHWGIPDVLAAMPYAWAYGEYIRDASSLLKALNMIAWKVVGKSKTQAQLGGVQLSQANRAGGTAAMTTGTELTSMPRAGQVDMHDGLALAAMVASALSVPVTALLSDSSVGGSQGSVIALDGPTVAAARARQLRWVRFYSRVFRAMNIEGLEVDFPKITEDPIHRQISSLATVRATGAIWADEYRDAVLEALDVKPEHDSPPDAEEYAQAQNALGFLQMLENTRLAEEAAEQAQEIAQMDPVSKQGNTGVGGKTASQDGTNRRQDTAAKKGSQTDLVG